MKKKELFLCPISGLPIRKPIIINHSGFDPLIYDRSSVEAAIAAGEAEEWGIKPDDFHNILLVDQFSQAILALIDRGVTSIDLSDVKRQVAVANENPHVVGLRCGITWEFPKSVGVLCKRDGRTYDKEALEKSLRLVSLSPFTKHVIDPALDIIVHPIHQRIIAEMQGNESGVVNLEDVLDNLIQRPQIYPFRNEKSRAKRLLRGYLLGATTLRVIAIHVNTLFNLLSAYPSKNLSFLQSNAVLSVAMASALVDLQFYRALSLKTEESIGHTESLMMVLYTCSSVFLFFNFSEMELFKINGGNLFSHQAQKLFYHPHEYFFSISKLGKLVIAFSVMPQLMSEISSFRDMIKALAINEQSSVKAFIKAYLTVSSLTLFGAASQYWRYYRKPMLLAPSDLLEVCTVILVGGRLREMFSSPQARFHCPSFLNSFLFVVVAISLVLTLEDFSLNSLLEYLAPLVFLGSKIFMQSEPLSTDQSPVITSENLYRFMPKPKQRLSLEEEDNQVKSGNITNPLA